MSELIHIMLHDHAWTIFPGSDGGLEVLLSLSFLLISLILLRYVRRSLIPIAILYLIGVLFFTLMIRTAGTERMAILKPFQTIRNAIGWDGWFVIVDRYNLYMLIANVLLFMPFGYILPSLVPATGKWYLIVPLGLLASLCIETIQYFTKLGCFDLDDLIANTLGAFVGYMLFLLFLRRRR